MKNLKVGRKRVKWWMISNGWHLYSWRRSAAVTWANLISWPNSRGRPPVESRIDRPYQPWPILNLRDIFFIFRRCFSIRWYLAYAATAGMSGPSNKTGRVWFSRCRLRPCWSWRIVSCVTSTKKMYGSIPFSIEFNIFDSNASAIMYLAYLWPTIKKWDCIATNFSPFRHPNTIKKCIFLDRIPT